MSNWLEQLERELDQRLAAFLSQNPVQEQLFRQQHQLDRAIKNPDMWKDIWTVLMK